MARTLKCQYTFEMPNFDKVSDAAKDFISSLLKLNAEERFSAEQCLNHPWLTDNRVSPLVVAKCQCWCLTVLY